MLYKINRKKFARKKSKLGITPGEQLRDALIQIGMKTAEESAYVAGNNTDKVIKLSENLGGFADRTTEFVGGTESSAALGKILFKTTKDVARGDSVCTGLCAISATCETVAICCSTVKSIPFRGRIYIGAKMISRGCMSFRNACAGEGC